MNLNFENQMRYAAGTQKYLADQHSLPQDLRITDLAGHTERAQ